MPRKHLCKLVFWGVLLALVLSFFPLFNVKADGEIQDPGGCTFQPPAADRAPTMQSIRIDAMILGSGNLTKDKTYEGLHRWYTNQWPGVDYLVPTTIIFKNGGTVRNAAWDGAGGGYSLFIDGEGPCQGWYIFIGHLNYNPAYRYKVGQHIGPNEIIGEPGCSGFEIDCVTKGLKIPKHNHYSLGYQSNIFSFTDGTVPAYVGAHYWIHPVRVDGTAGQTASVASPAAPDNPSEATVPDYIDSGGVVVPDFTDNTNGDTQASVLTWDASFIIPAWAYIAVSISILLLFFRKIRLLGIGGLIVTAIFIAGFYFVEPAAAAPPQMVYMTTEDLIDIPADPTPVPEPTAVAEDPSAPQKINSAGKPSDNPKDYPLNVSTPCEVSPRFLPRVLEWCGLITYYAKLRGLDPDLIAAVITQESGGQVEPCVTPQTVNGIPICGSKDGAIGLMQVMPSDGLSGRKYRVFVNRPTCLELLNPEANIAYGTKMLANLSAATQPREALFHYGPSGGGYYYADIVMGIYNRNR